MSQLKFNFGTNVSPPGRFQHVHVDGHVSIADERDLWLRFIAKHEKDNGREQPEGWQADAEDRFCKVLPPGLCKYPDGSNPNTFINVRMTPEDWTHGMVVLARVALSGLLGGEGPLVDQATAESRARICAACPANVTVHGCSSCADAPNKIAEIRGASHTEADTVLKSCGVCKCSNRAQVWVRAELLADGVSEDQLRQFDSLPWCWKGQAIRALQNSQQPA